MNLRKERKLEFQRQNQNKMNRRPRPKGGNIATEKCITQSFTTYIKIRSKNNLLLNSIDKKEKVDFEIRKTKDKFYLSNLIYDINEPIDKDRHVCTFVPFGNSYKPIWQSTVPITFWISEENFKDKQTQIKKLFEFEINIDHDQEPMDCST